MEPQNIAAATVAPGSVETPGSETTTQATPAAREAQASATPTQPVSRENRRSKIADWLDQPTRTPATPQDKTAATATDNGSPSVGQGGASQDLSQSPPNGEAEATATDEAAGEATPEGEAEPTAADPAAPKGNWPKEAVERVRKLKDQKQQLKGELADRDSALQRLEAEVRELRSAVQKPAAETKLPTKDVLAGESDAAVIRTKADEAAGVVTWAEDLLEVVADDPDTVSGALEAEGLKAPEGGWSVDAMRHALRGIKTNARSVVQAAPKRLEHIQREDQSLAAAVKLAPELEDSESDLSQRVAAVIAARPIIKDWPDWPLVATAAVIGLQTLQERQKAAGTPKPAAPVPAARPVPKAPRMPGAPRSSVAAGQASEVNVVRERATRPGATREDRLAYVRQQLTQGSATATA